MIGTTLGTLPFFDKRKVRSNESTPLDKQYKIIATHENIIGRGWKPYINIVHYRHPHFMSQWMCKPFSEPSQKVYNEWAVSYLTPKAVTGAKDNNGNMRIAPTFHVFHSRDSTETDRKFVTQKHYKNGYVYKEANEYKTNEEFHAIILVNPQVRGYKNKMEFMKGLYKRICFALKYNSRPYKEYLFNGELKPDNCHFRFISPDDEEIPVFRDNITVYQNNTENFKTYEWGITK